MCGNILKNAIILTGGISTGKSTVCQILKENNFNIIDADEIAHKLLDENYENIEKLFGKQYVKNKKVLRKELGKIIFSSEENKLKLEALLHPLIKDEIYKKAKVLEKEDKMYFIDNPLYFEKMKYPASKVLLVYTPKERQVQRLMKRDDISEELALLKISNQLDIEEKKILADIIIDNSKDLEHLKKEVKKALGELNDIYKI